MPVTFAEKISRIPHYESGMHIEAARKRYGLDEIVKLASNESPFPPVQAVLDAIAAEGKSLNRYPDPEANKLRSALSERYDLPKGQIAVGNGSCEILLAAADALLEPGCELVYAWPSFSIYPHMAAMATAFEKTVPLDGSFTHDLEAMLEAIDGKTKLAVICNPNNPTATYLSSEAIAGFLERVPNDVCVILDQAYIEFQTVEDPDVSLDLLESFPNLVLLRTFSKVYGLCGLRCGYALCSEQFRQAVDQVRQPFSVNSLAQVAATVALEYQDDVSRRVEQNAIERLWLEEAVDEIGLARSESQANFCWIALGRHSEDEVVQGLAERGVIVRSGKALGAVGHARVTFGARSENERFIDALAQVVGSKG